MLILILILQYLIYRTSTHNATPPYFPVISPLHTALNTAQLQRRDPDFFPHSHPEGSSKTNPPQEPVDEWNQQEPAQIILVRK